MKMNSLNVLSANVTSAFSKPYFYENWSIKMVLVYFFFTWRYLKISIPIDSKNNDKLFILCLL